MWQRYWPRESPFRARGRVGKFRTSAIGRGGSGWKIVFMPAVVGGQGGGAVLDGVLERVTFANPETGYTIARIAPDRGPGAGAPSWSRRSGRCWARRSASPCGCAAGGRPTRSTAGSSRCTPTPRCCPPRRGHPEVPGLGPDQGHRPGDGRADGQRTSAWTSCTSSTTSPAG